MARWFHWMHWGFAIGSSDRYTPKFWERRAYTMGLRDAARIAENRRFATDTGIPSDDPEHRARRNMGREIILAIHRHTTDTMGLSNDDTSGLT